MGGARVEVLGKNGIPVLSAATDENGRLQIPALSSFKNEKEPTAYLVSRNDDLSFIPVAAPGKRLDYSSFDTGGVHGTSDPERIDAYLFSDRGIYRPGDEFHIGMIVKPGDWKIPIAGTPLEAVVQDSRGMEIAVKKFRVPPQGFEELSYRSESGSPTGVYQINLYTVKDDRRSGMIGSTTVKSREFLPDRLSISSVILSTGTKGWVSPEKLEAQITLRNLFGFPAAGNRIEASFDLSPGALRFERYSDYSFLDPQSADKSYTQDLEDITTDDEGKARYELDLSRFEAGTFRLSFSATGFEKEGGRNVSTGAQVLVSSLPYLIGTKANGDLSYIYRNTARSLKIIAIDPDLETTEVSDAEFRLSEIRQISVLTKLPNGTYAYRSTEKVVPVETKKLAIPAGGFEYPLPTGSAGHYELVIADTSGTVFSRTRFTVVGTENVSRSLDKTAELEVKLSKEDYRPGEEIEVYVKAPYTGAGIITIERDRVYAYKWFKSTTNGFIEKIRLPEDLEGNGYVNVSFIRAADSKEIYMSPLSYGVAPFSVSRARQTNTVTLSVAAEARSGRVLPIRYSSEKAGKIVVFAVDEGILQVAHYDTPDPLSFFFKKRALEVRTAQILDLILPEFSLSPSTGAMGGGAGFDDIAKNLNPFKRKQDAPVVFWSGILDTGPEERTLEYTVPDYFNGTLRVMAVAVAQDTLGVTEKKSVVKNPFVISPNAPLFAAPGDSFEVNVVVTNALDGSGKALPVSVEALPSADLKVEDAKRELTIDEKNDAVLSFKVTALDKPGAASISFTASGGGESAKLSSTLSVRPVQPYRTQLVTGVLSKGKTEIATPRRLYEEYRVLETGVSFCLSGSRGDSKVTSTAIPTACSEQIISASFPYLYLRDKNGFGVREADAAQKTAYAVKVLLSRQNGDGDIGLWTANSERSDFMTVYAMHYLSECRASGYPVPETLMKNGLSALRNIVERRGASAGELRMQAYAAYILTRNEILATAAIASIRENLERKMPDWKEDIAAAYLAASYGLMRQRAEAVSLMKSVLNAKPDVIDKSFYADGFTRSTQTLYIAARHFPDLLKGSAEPLISAVGDFLAAGRYNTLTSAYAVMALDAYAAVAGTPENGRVTLSQVRAGGTTETLTLPDGNFPVVAFREDAEKLLLENRENRPLYYQTVQGGFDTALPSETVTNGLEVFREFLDEDGNTVESVAQGDEITVRIRIRSTGGDIPNVAIVDLLPAGLETVPTSVRENTRSSFMPEYLDIREDRMIVFGTARADSKEFSYRARAINRGEFSVPPIYAESMYDKTIYGIRPQTPLTVR